jgi:hypothetical protein
MSVADHPIWSSIAISGIVDRFRARDRKGTCNLLFYGLRPLLARAVDCAGARATVTLA